MDFKEVYKEWMDYKDRAAKAWQQVNAAYVESNRLRKAAEDGRYDAEYYEEEAAKYKAMLDEMSGEE